MSPRLTKFLDISHQRGLTIRCHVAASRHGCNRRCPWPPSPRPGRQALAYARTSQLNRPAMNRRQYLRESGRAVLGFSLLPLAGCGSLEHSERQAATESPVADLERQIPQWLEEAKVPGLSIAI